MTDKMQLPAHMRQYADQQGQSDADSMAASSISIPRISLKGKKFKYIVGGEESAKSDSIRVVILKVEPEKGLMIKTFYANGYNPNDTAPPDCSSTNGITPDDWVTSPQHHRCSDCKKNVFGSATSSNGKKTKACRDAKRLWVVKEDDIGGTVFGLNIPVTSLKALSEYGAMIKKNQFPLTGVITEVSMDEDSEFPMLQFAHVGFLEEEPWNAAIARSSALDWTGLGQAPALGYDKSDDAAPKANLADAAKQIAESVAQTTDTATSKPAEKAIEGEVVQAKTGGTDANVGDW